jgi:hypothetical protein
VRCGVERKEKRSEEEKVWVRCGVGTWMICMFSLLVISVVSNYDIFNIGGHLLGTKMVSMRG